MKDIFHWQVFKIKCQQYLFTGFSQGVHHLHQLRLHFPMVDIVTDVHAGNLFSFFKFFLPQLRLPSFFQFIQPGVPCEDLYKGADAAIPPELIFFHDFYERQQYFLENILRISIIAIILVDIGPGHAELCSVQLPDGLIIITIRAKALQ